MAQASHCPRHFFGNRRRPIRRPSALSLLGFLGILGFLSFLGFIGFLSLLSLLSLLKILSFLSLPSSLVFLKFPLHFLPFRLCSLTRVISSLMPPRSTKSHFSLSIKPRSNTSA